MVPVPAGAFTMGCNTCDPDEAPSRQVVVSAFAIDRTEVTQASYDACVSGGGCSPPSANFSPATTPDLPVTNVTWNQAVTYCMFVGKRLPTEAEWEKAARGTDGRTYPWGNTPGDCSFANVAGCGDVPLPVGTHPAGASPYGALDMAGNVWEWVNDYYAADAYTTEGTTDPTGPATGTYRVYRGGSAGNDITLARTSNRAATYNPAVGGSGLGFRCAK